MCRVRTINDDEVEMMMRIHRLTYTIPIVVNTTSTKHLIKFYYLLTVELEQL